MKKKVLTRIVSACLCGAMAVSMSLGLSGCGNGDSSSGDTVIQYWVSGSSAQLDMFTRCTEEFNDTYGKEHGIYVQISQKPLASYQDTIKISANSTTGPDVYHISDSEFKAWISAGYISSIQEEFDAVTDIDLGDIMETTVSRLRFDVETNTSNEGDPLYGLPLDAQPTAIYYNKSMLEEAGVIVISVDEEDLAAWNKNEIADNTGKYKKDYGIDENVTIPAKGYYRSEFPYYYNGNKTKEWVAFDPNEELAVFNNRIAMNWDEVEDLAMIFSAEYNPGKSSTAENPVTDYGTTYGYFTENWFNYGWSVGGDCLNDLTGEGEWNFSLLDPNPNYVVKEEQTFTGRTGKVYQGGETISFVDKMDIQNDEVLVPDDNGEYYHNNANLKMDSAGEYATGGDKAGIWGSITAELAKGDTSVLSELPSTREAFNRYLRLGATKKTDVDGASGLNVSPNPNVFSTRTSMNYFFSGKLALLMQSSVYMKDLSEQAKERGFEWDVAPLAVYKQYSDPADPDCDTVVARGKLAGHSNTINMVARPNSQNLQEAVAFMKWMAGPDGQRVRAKLGFFPNQKSLIDELQFDAGTAPQNVRAFSDELEYARPGDWWYMPDTLWVEAWCIDLNSYVRNGTMTYKEWLKGKDDYSYGSGSVVTRTNRYLKNYRKYSR